MAPSLAASLAAAAAAAVAAAPTAAAAAPGLTVAVDPATGAYGLQFGGGGADDWATALGGGGVLVRSGGALLTGGTPAAKGLTLAAPPAVTTGSDGFGAFTRTSLTWDAPGAPGLVVTSFNEYASPTFGPPGTSAVVFEQAFPRGLQGCSCGNSMEVATGFPILGPPPGALDTQLGYLTYGGMNIMPYTGRWAAGGLPGQAFGAGWANGMLALMNASLATVVVGPLGDFFTAYLTQPGSTGGALAFGFNGEMGGVPPGYVLRSIAVGGQGVADTVHAWGDALLAVGGKPRTGVQQDFFTSYLSYWFDNGG